MSQPFRILSLDGGDVMGAISSPFSDQQTVLDRLSVGSCHADARWYNWIEQAGRSIVGLGLGRHAYAEPRPGTEGRHEEGRAASI